MKQLNGGGKGGIKMPIEQYLTLAVVAGVILFGLMYLIDKTGDV